MEKMALVSKPRQSQRKLDELMAQIWEKYSKGTGADGCRFEKVTAQLMSARGIETAEIAGAGVTDLIVFPMGPDGKRHRFNCEIKSGCGIVTKHDMAKQDDNILAHSEDEIYPEADLIIFAPRADEFSELDELLDETLVLTRYEFLEFLYNNTGKQRHGFDVAFKLATNNGALRAKNAEREPRMVLDKKNRPVLYKASELPDGDPRVGTPKYTMRGVAGRWTDCITIQEAYRDQLVEAVLANWQYTTLRCWLEDNGRG